MAKWTSVLFSDIRNKLGDQVVFSNWKGRPYMRTYTKPANPNTLRQQANRDHMRKIIERYQTVVNADDIKAAWNEAALPYGISGYNLFVKFAKKSKISCPATAAVGSTITITYTIGFPVADAKIYRENPDGSLTDITPTEGLREGENQTITDTVSSAGTYKYWIAYSKVLVAGDTGPQQYQAINNWEPDYSTGIADPAEVTVS